MFMGRRLLRAVLAGAMLAAAIVSPTAVFASHTAPDYTVPHNAQDPNGNTNDEAYWEWFLATNEGGTWECTKFNVAVDPVLNGTEDAVIIKAGTTNYVWIDPHQGTYSAPENSTSHYFICTGGLVEDIVIEPDGEIGGPCADPAYYGIFDNTDSNVAVRFRFRWYTNYGFHTVTKWVEAGDVYRTWERWAKPFTTIRVGYWDGDSWVNLDTEIAGKGRYPACDYKRGVSQDPIGTYEPDLRNDL